MLLDASALLALLYDEPGSTAVQKALPGATICSVNLSEVTAKLATDGLKPNEIREATTVGIQVIDFDTELAYLAGQLAPRSRSLGLSLGDRACFAAAMKHEQPILTADRIWHKLKLGPAIHLIR